MDTGTQTTQPVLFIGSARENIDVVDALEAELREVATVQRWDLDVFEPGRFTLEDLAAAASGIDFAVFVLGREDTTQSRGNVVASPRDNVIFEAGLFTAALGRKRTYYVVDRQGTKIPSDWAGLTYLTFDSSALRSRDKVYEAAARIRESVSRFGALSRDRPEASIIGPWWQFVVNADEGSVVSLLEITRTSPCGGIDVRGRAWSQGGTVLAQYRSRAASFVAQEATLYYAWDGEHPRDSQRPDYFGVGRITFELRNGITERGHGWYSTSRRSDLGSTHLKSIECLRAATEDLHVLEGGAPEARTALIQTKLSERPNFLV